MEISKILFEIESLNIIELKLLLDEIKKEIKSKEKTNSDSNDEKEN